MASTSLVSIGGNVLSGSIRSFNTLGRDAGFTVGWFPLTSQDNIFRRFASIEIFWCVTGSTPSGQAIFTVANQPNNSFIMELYFVANGTLRFRFRDRANSQITLDAAGFDFAGADRNIWWHTVLIGQSNSIWIVRHGRVGVDVNGNPSASDTYPNYPRAAITAAGSGGTSLMGFRQAPANNVNICFGARQSVSGVTSNPFDGAFAELRCWASPLNNTQYNEIRDEFIQDNLLTNDFPDLIHCFRFNEPSGSAVSGFEDVGLRGAFFETAVTGAAFPSHPFGLVTGQNIPLVPVQDDATFSESAVLNRTRSLIVVPSDFVTSEVAPTVRLSKGFSSTDDTTFSELAPTLDIARGFSATDDMVTSELNQGMAVERTFVSVDDTMETSELDLVMRVNPGFSATDDMVTEEDAVLHRTLSLIPVEDDAVTSELITTLDIVGAPPEIQFSATDDALFSELSATLDIARGFSATDDMTTEEDAPTIDKLIGFSATDDMTTEEDGVISDAMFVGLGPAQATMVTTEGGTDSDQFTEELEALGPPTWWWKLDETAGSTTVADSGSAGTGGGEVSGADLGATGLLSQKETSAEFLDNSDFIRSTGGTGIWQTSGGNDDYSLGVQFQLNSFSAGGAQTILETNSYCRIRVNDDGSIVFSRFIESLSFQDAQSAPGVIQLGQTYHVVATRQRIFSPLSLAGTRLYVNGVEVARFDSNDDVGVNIAQNIPTNRQFYIGAQTGGVGELFDGRIQHPWFWDGMVLSEADALNLYNAGQASGGGAPSLIIERGFSATDDMVTSEVAPTISTGDLEVIIEETESIDAPLLGLEQYVSVLDIWNVALTKLGIEHITTISDQVPQALSIAANWDLFKESFLRDHAWNGAKTTAELVTFKNDDGVTAVTPSGGRWTYAYELPGSPKQWVRSLRLNGQENRPGAKSADGTGLWEEEVVFNDVATPKLCLLCDESVAKLEYIFLISDANISELLPADMKWAMAISLAAHMAADFAKTTEEQSIIERDAEQARRNARRTDGQSASNVQQTERGIHDSFY